MQHSKNILSQDQTTKPAYTRNEYKANEQLKMPPATITPKVHDQTAIEEGIKILSVETRKFIKFKHNKQCCVL
jgi:hypothetical protein